MKKHSILLCAVFMCAAFLSLTGCPQFDRDIDPDYQLFKEKKTNNGGKKKDDPGPSNPVSAFTLEIDHAFAASNGKIYANGAVEAEGRKNVLYEIPADVSSMKTINKVFEDDISVITEVNAGTLLVASGNKIYRVTLSSGTADENAFVEFDYPVRDIINFKNKILVITNNSNTNATSTYWEFVSETGSKTRVSFPTNDTDPTEQQVAPGYGYLSVNDKNIVVYIHSRENAIYGATIDLADPSSPMGISCLCGESQGKSGVKGPLFLFDTLKIITAGGHAFKIENTNSRIDVIYNTYKLNSRWLVYVYDSPISKEFDLFYTDKSKIYLSTTNTTSGNSEVEIRNYSSPSASGAKSTFKSEKGIGIYKIGDNIYLITNNASNNVCVHKLN